MPDTKAEPRSRAVRRASERGPLYNYDEAAEYLNTTPRHVRKLCETRQLASVKVGNLVRLDQADMDDYIERQRRPAVG